MMGMAIALFVAGSVQAQDQTDKASKARSDMQTERMVKELGLNDEQARKVAEINVEYAKKMDALRSDREDARTEIREKQRSLHEARMAEYERVLEPEQMEKLNEMEKTRQKERMERRRGMMKTDEAKPQRMEHEQKMKHEGSMERKELK